VIASVVTLVPLVAALALRVVISALR